MMMSGFADHWRQAAGDSARWLAGRFPGRPGQARRVLLDEAEKAGAADIPLAGPVELVYPADRVVTRVIRLPSAAMTRARQMIAPRISEWSPWPEDACLWNLSVEEVRDGLVACRVIIAPREQVTAAMAALLSRGAAAVRVSVQSPAGPDILLPLTDDGRPLAALTRRVMAGVLGISALITVLAGLAAGQAVMAGRAADEAEARIAALSPGGQGRLTQGLAELVQRKSDLRPAAGVLAALARAVPDGSWLTQASLADGGFTITGKSSGVDALMAGLAQEPGFASVDFAAPTAKDGETGRLVFSISGRIAGAPGGQP